MTAITKTKKKGNLALAYKKFDWQKSVDLGEAVYGKQPPQATKLEEAILGAIMLDKDAIDKVKDIISQASFYVPAHQLIYKAMMQLREAEQEIDMLTVTTKLRANEELEAAGNPHYLAELTSRVASSANIESHATIIQQYYMRRLMIEVSTFAIKYSYEDQHDVFDLHDWFTKEVAQVTMNQRWKYKELLESIKTERTKTENPYPTEAFPERIRKLVEEFAYCKNIPVSFFFSSLLTVVSAAIGNGLRMRYRTDYETSHAVYMALVAPPGIGKTWAIKMMASPLMIRDRELQEIHKLAIESWRERKREYESKQAELKSPEPFSEPPPACQQTFVDDFTMEALVKVFLNNKKGTFGFMDELIALFNALNAYRSKGSDGQKFLKIFDGSAFKINRSNGDPITIWNTFMSLVGGIQPEVLRKMADGGRVGDGTMGRFNFDYPEIPSRPDPNNEEIRDESIRKYHELIQYIMELPTYYNQEEYEDPKPIGIPFTDAARQVYFDWLVENNKKYNAADQESEQTVHVKSENQCLRFALLIQVLMWACEDKKIDSATTLGFMRIDVPALKAAFELIEYYRHCSLKVLDKLESPLAKLNPEYRAIYKELPDIFKTKDVMKLAKAAGIGENTLRRNLLRNKELVRPLNGKSGTYQKCVA